MFYITIHRIQRLPPTGGIGQIFSDAQETALIVMVSSNNAIKLGEIWDRVLAVNVTFANVSMVSTTTIARVLEKHKIRMKQLYTPSKRNGYCVKELLYQYVQVRCLFNDQIEYIHIHSYA